MEHPEYELQHSTTPQPRLLDGECATRDWPMPPVKAWEPRQAAETAWPELAVWGEVWSKTAGFDATARPSAEPNEYETLHVQVPRGWPFQAAIEADQKEAEDREAMVRAPRPDPAEEKNPVARLFTRLMTWSQR